MKMSQRVGVWGGGEAGGGGVLNRAPESHLNPPLDLHRSALMGAHVTEDTFSDFMAHVNWKFGWLDWIKETLF